MAEITGVPNNFDKLLSNYQIKPDKQHKDSCWECKNNNSQHEIFNVFDKNGKNVGTYTRYNYLDGNKSQEVEIGDMRYVDNNADGTIDYKQIRLPNGNWDKIDEKPNDNKLSIIEFVG